MSRDKQIEEMAKIICAPTAKKGNCDKCGFKRHCSKFDDATDLYNAGYRKVDSVTFMGGIVEQMRADIAEEIFAEIEETFKECLWFLENHPSDYPRMDRTKINVYKDNLQYIAEIKNKYKGE